MSTPVAPVSNARLPFSAHQLAIIVIIGWTVWFLGALLCRFSGAMGWFDGTSRILLYAAVIPGTVPVIFLIKRTAQTGDAHIALASSIATAAAIMLDGIALAWFPALYGPGIAQTAASGAVILWGGFVAITLGCLFNKAG
jgi:hypothetical protein